jgi:hypothetical protein
MFKHVPKLKFQHVHTSHSICAKCNVEIFWYFLWHIQEVIFLKTLVNLWCNPTLKECEDDTHTHEMGTWDSPWTPKNLEFDCKGPNTSPWHVLYTVGKVSKCKRQKWPCMSHLDICSTSYGWKKSQESNCQFDSRPLKVRNQLDPGVCRWSATHHWKAIEESYKFALDFIPAGGLSKELWTPKVPGV